MAITRTIARPMTREEDRVAAVTVDMPPSGGFSIHASRVVTGRANDGSIVGSPRGGAQIARSSARISSETVTLASGAIVRVTDIVEALDLLADRWGAEDDAARAQGPAPRPEAGTQQVGRPDADRPIV
jgi:hypothetical protein